MRIKAGLKLKPDRHGKIEIPDCSRDDIPQFFVDMRFKKGVEIGTYLGKYTEKFCKAGLKMYTVDPYIQHRDYHPNRAGFVDRCEEIYHEAKTRLAPYDCHIIRLPSMNAVRCFDDESLDFVYIDGNHQLKYVIEDIHEWSFKVKKGGVISGHDYTVYKDRIHAKIAVDAHVKAWRIDTLFILGKKGTDNGFRSWFWIKK